MLLAGDGRIVSDNRRLCRTDESPRSNDPYLFVVHGAGSRRSKLAAVSAFRFITGSAWAGMAADRFGGRGVPDIFGAGPARCSTSAAAFGYFFAALITRS